jgi:hypothetical protein
LPGGFDDLFKFCLSVASRRLIPFIAASVLVSKESLSPTGSSLLFPPAVEENDSSLVASLSATLFRYFPLSSLLMLACPLRTDLKEGPARVEVVPFRESINICSLDGFWFPHNPCPMAEMGWSNSSDSDNFKSSIRGCEEDPSPKSL